MDVYALNLQLGTLGQHSDVDLTGLAQGKILKYNATTSKFEVADESAGSGEANTASNLGAGEGVFSAKSGVDLQFKSLVAGTNVSLSSDSDTVTINSTDTNETNLGYTASPTEGTVTNDTGTNATLPLADVTNAGLMSPSDKTSINNLGDLAPLDVVGTSQITDNSVTFEKLEDIATNHLIGRNSAGSGDPRALSATQVRSLLNVEDGATANSSDASLLDRANHTGTQTASTISDFDTEVSNNSDVSANTSARHDAVTVTDSSEIDFTLTGQNITASLIAGSIDETKLDTSVNTSLDLADSSLQSSDIGVTVQAHSTVLDATTASYTTTEESKLIGIEPGAQVNTIDSDPTGVTGADQITNIISLTQAEYDAITPNASTFYVITDAV